MCHGVQQTHFHPRSHSEVCHTLPHTAQCYTSIHSVPPTSSTSSRPCLLLPLLKAFKSFAPAPLYQRPKSPSQRPKCRPNFKLQLLRNRNPSPSSPPTVFNMSDIIRGLGPNREQEMEDFLMEDRLLGVCKKLICGWLWRTLINYCQPPQAVTFLLKIDKSVFFVQVSHLLLIVY